MARYIVEYQALNTGEWYIKTETDSSPAAHSLANWGASYGRAYRLIDTETGETLIEEGPAGTPEELK